MEDLTIENKALKLIYNNTRNDGGDTKLLARARTMYDKIISTTYRNGHFILEVEGSNGEIHEASFFKSGKVWCTCRFCQDLETWDRQAVGCKHLLTGALFLLSMYPEQDEAA